MNNIMEITQFEKEVFDYLNDLRESGVKNMYGACPYIEDEFQTITHEEAIKVLAKWMKNFNPNGYDDLKITNK
jgi:hypothetical protein